MPTQSERIEALEAALQALTQNNEVLNNALNLANERLDTQQETIATQQATIAQAGPVNETPAPATKTHEPKVASPEFFYGQRNKVNQFITQLRMVITLQPSRFEDEKTKVGYAATFLRDEGLLWIQPFLSKSEYDQPEWLKTFDAFAKELKRIFGDPDEVATAERRIQSLSQRGSLAKYITEFRRCAAIVTWDDAALCSHFYRGLRGSIKDELARIGKPDDLEDLINTSIRIDNRLFERQIERSNEPPLYNARPFDMSRSGLVNINASPPPCDPFRRAPAPRQPSLRPDQRYAGPPQPSRNFTPAGRLMPDEYKRRVALGACVYCGEMGHAVKDCPKKKRIDPSKPQQFRGTLFSCMKGVNQGKE